MITSEPTETSTSTSTTEVDMEITSTSTSTVIPRAKVPGCTQNGAFYVDGSSIETEDPCEHCYCIQGTIACSVTSCMGELDGDADHCEPVQPAAGECCPTEYKCGKIFF